MYNAYRVKDARDFEGGLWVVSTHRNAYQIQDGTHNVIETLTPSEANSLIRALMNLLTKDGHTVVMGVPSQEDEA